MTQGHEKSLIHGPARWQTRGMKPPSETFGKRLAHLRRAKGWSQSELAARIGTKSNQISKFETGAYQPGLETLSKLAEALQTTTDFLLAGREPNEVRGDARLRARLPLLENLPRELRDVVVEFLDTLLNTHETIERVRKRGGKDER
jgi:transcriptional regulator with XRE-family HTH domain